jgi:hypothetical protein
MNPSESTPSRDGLPPSSAFQPRLVSDPARDPRIPWKNFRRVDEAQSAAEARDELRRRITRSFNERAARASWHRMHGGA